MRKKFWLFLLLLSFLPHFCQADPDWGVVVKVVIWISVLIVGSLIINIIAIIVYITSEIKKLGLLWFTLSVNVVLFLFFGYRLFPAWMDEIRHQSYGRIYHSWDFILFIPVVYAFFIVIDILLLINKTSPWKKIKNYLDQKNLEDE